MFAFGSASTGQSPIGGGSAPDEYMRQGATRLQYIDFLRGVALTIVLLDHVDWFARRHGNGFFRDWTLMGLGFSDAAEAFVFLSGMAFGWAYTKKIANSAVRQVQARLLVRSLQIYIGYLTTAAIVMVTSHLIPEATSAALLPSNEDNLTLGNTVLAVASLTHQPFALGILCLYIVVLPFLPMWLAAFRRHPWVAISLSTIIYAAVQFYPHLRMPAGHWYFNPFAWQFLFVVGVVCGHRGRRGRRLIPSRPCVLTAALFILYGVLIKKCPRFMSDGYWMDFHSWLMDGALLSKTNLGLLRLLHFLALAYLLMLALPRCESAWLRRLTKLFVLCGRNSLPVYCIGVVLAYFSAIVFYLLGATLPVITVVAIDACTLHFLASYALDSRRRFGSA